MDATEIAQAKAYGAIILARGNMAEWAFTNAISIGSGLLTLLHTASASSLLLSQLHTSVSTDCITGHTSLLHQGAFICQATHTVKCMPQQPLALP